MPGYGVVFFFVLMPVAGLFLIIQSGWIRPKVKERCPQITWFCLSPYDDLKVLDEYKKLCIEEGSSLRLYWLQLVLQAVFLVVLVGTMIVLICRT